MKPKQINSVAEFENQIQKSLELAKMVRLSAEEIEMINGGTQENPPRMTGKIVQSSAKQ
ncbi:Uncharacterized protein ChrSV_1492 [Chromobacterium vaccinii]|uniref:hypothetical protein n=1 Tax=Chromobacterium vaccinii TaxID=1108595 RepID=UPI000E14A695|nr:hypothetical protein [Chromobacterium vaccinii]QND83719.1 Uncharacterized protein ChrSW_1492 [Chromobacterium vaccinii]QND88950.1 Uncharacterized protein ChrSV_1492 [Chromobacterium vaccinii]SUX55021.1 Uncharacterised protein [Chromobacterium vaccinii]